MKIKISDKLIDICDDGYVYEIAESTLIPTIICDLHGNVLAGIEWCWDVIEKQQGRKIQYLFIETNTPASAQYN